MKRIIGVGISGCLLATFFIFPACGLNTDTVLPATSDTGVTTSPVASSIIPSETTSTTANNTSPTFTATFIMNPPYLSLSNNLFNFDIQQGASPKYDWFYLSADVDKVDWSIVVDSSWVKLSQLSGTATKATTQIKVTVDATGLAKGAYICKMTMTASAFGFPNTLEVHLTVT